MTQVNDKSLETTMEEQIEALAQKMGIELTSKQKTSTYYYLATHLALSTGNKEAFIHFSDQLEKVSRG